MSSPTKLFLEQNPFDSRWKVLDNDEFCFGEGETPEDAIRSARVVTDAPIYANREFKGIIDEVLDVSFKTPEELSEDETIYSKDGLIEVLADLGGFRIFKIYDDYRNLLGYTMELIE
jgi:hypothetical protein